MAKKMAIAAAALQYSKWMSRFICWCWIIYRFAALVAGVIRPEAAESFAAMIINLDWIMLVNEGTYLINSLGEKYLYSDKYILRWLDKGGFRAMMGKISLFSTKKHASANTSEEEEDEENGGEEDGDYING